jgi:hypothetical protein
MAVSLSSDLIVDVMRSADPARLNVATAKLQELHMPGGSSTAFASMLDSVGATAAPLEFPSAPVAHSRATSVAPQPYVEFEQMVLRNLFESLLPKAESGAFGTGPSAGIWRSLAADQLAGLYANSGGIGIASTLAGAGDGGSSAQWPYFESGKIEAFTG